MTRDEYQTLTAASQGVAMAIQILRNLDYIKYSGTGYNEEYDKAVREEVSRSCHGFLMTLTRINNEIVRRRESHD